MNITTDYILREACVNCYFGHIFLIICLPGEGVEGFIDNILIAFNRIKYLLKMKDEKQFMSKKSANTGLN